MSLPRPWDASVCSAATMHAHSDCSEAKSRDVAAGTPPLELHVRHIRKASMRGVWHLHIPDHCSHFMQPRFLSLEQPSQATIPQTRQWCRLRKTPNAFLHIVQEDAALSLT